MAGELLALWEGRSPPMRSTRTRCRRIGTHDFDGALRWLGRVSPLIRRSTRIPVTCFNFGIELPAAFRCLRSYRLDTQRPAAPSD